MNRVQALVGRNQPSFEVLRCLDRPIGAHENSVAFVRRFPFRCQTDDWRALKLSAEEIWQIEIRRLHVATNQSLLLFLAGRIGKFDNLHIDPVGFHLAEGKSIIGAKHAEAIAIVREGYIHFTPQVESRPFESSCASAQSTSQRSSSVTPLISRP